MINTSSRLTGVSDRHGDDVSDDSKKFEITALEAHVALLQQQQVSCSDKSAFFCKHYGSLFDGFHASGWETLLNSLLNRALQLNQSSRTCCTD